MTQTNGKASQRSRKKLTPWEQNKRVFLEQMFREYDQNTTHMAKAIGLSIRGARMNLRKFGIRRNTQEELPLG